MREGHERNKILFVCTDIKCNYNEKFGCAHCFLEGHEDHALRKIRIDEFVGSIEAKETRFVESVSNLRHVGKLLGSPAFLKTMLIELDRLKDDFVKGVDVIKENLT